MTDVYCAADHVLLKTDYNDPEQHRHWAKHLIISLSGNISCMVENQVFSCEGIMISSNVSHTIKSNPRPLLVYLFDETSDIAQIMEEVYFQAKDYFIIDPYMVQKIRIAWQEGMANQNSVSAMATTYPNVCQKILHICGLCPQRAIKKDSRIQKSLELLQNMEEISDNTIAKLSQSLCLSQSRFSHLFKEQIGLSLNTFLVMLKIGKAYQYIFEGASITDAAIKAGFSSSSHFATVNKNMFGMSANQFCRGARVILI